WVDALNGRCLPAAWSEKERVKSGKPAHLRYDEFEAFSEALREAGFDSVQSFWVPICPRKLRLLQPLFETRLAVAGLGMAPSLAALLSHSILFRAVAR
ncbi:MAG TPA: hypothetical protein VK629_18745, partial [Steroidobacteraceae bacterium]|nr:hypothetical protein [Steroidobacteraceae bacterium]